MEPNRVRLQKFLADRGVASRRSCEAIIQAGRIQLNGETVTTPGTCVIPGQDQVTLDGDPVSTKRESSRTIVIYKPRGVICSASSKQGKTILDLVKGISERLVPAGRLDKDSEGLLILSNDGDLVLRLTHPRHGHAKTYQVTVSGEVTPAVLKQLRSRMILDGHRIQPATIKLLRASTKQGRHVLEMILKEGRNRQIRKMCLKAGLRIHRLVRTRIGNLTLKGLKPGEWRELP